MHITPWSCSQRNSTCAGTSGSPVSVRGQFTWLIGSHIPVQGYVLTTGPHF
jgi:hypothetical protein